MTLALATAARAGMLDGFRTFAGTGSGTATLTLYQGNQSLCVFNLATTPFSAAVNDGAVLASTPITNTGTAVAGTANRFVLNNRNSAFALSGTVGGRGSGADIETPTVAVTAALAQNLNALTLRLASTGQLSLEASLTLA